MSSIAISPIGSRFLTAPEFQRLAEVPPEVQWFVNLDSAQTRRAYQNDLRAFMVFVGITVPEEFRSVTRAHILAWRADLERQKLAGSTIRRKLAALASLYEFLCETNAVTHNPVKGVKRPKVDSYEGKTPALGDHQVRQLLEAPLADTLKGKRDRAILSVLLYHGLRREELTKLLVKDFNQMRRGVPHLRVQGKGAKLRYIPAHTHSLRLVSEYLEAAGHAQDLEGPLFRPMINQRAGHTATALTPGGSTVLWWCGTWCRWGSRGRTWGRTPCAPQLQRARLSMMRTLPRCRSGWGMPVSAPLGYMTGGGPSLRIRRRLKCGIDWPYSVSRGLI